MIKILLVEDDLMISEIYKRKFTISGFEVDTAMSAGEVFSKVQEGTYDVMLLDLVLPEMSGIEILEKLKKDPESYNPNMKVVIFSNLNDQENQDKAMRLGAIGFIEKSSFNPSELVAEVERMLHESDERMKNKEKRSETVFGEIRPIDSTKKKILFIEDESAFTEMFGDKLRDEGYEVDIETHGEEGVKKAIEGTYDLIVTDVMIPGIRGDEVIRRIRKNESTKDVPIFVLSASATDEEILHIEELGVREFCLKTRTTPSILLQKIQKVFEEE